MKHLFAPLLLGLSGVVLLADPVGAQVPFNSTSPPSPFNRFNSSTAPAQPNAASQQQGQSAGGNPPGYTYQSTAMNAAGAIDPNHKLTRGDQLSYSVQQDPDAKVWPLAVQDSGDVEVPLIGFVKAAGKTVAQLSGDIKSRLDSEYYYNATVSLGLNQIARGSTGRVFITGELAGHGALDLPADGQLTVSQAILQMGGPTDDSNLKHVHIIRKGAGPKGYIDVNVAAVLKGDSTKDAVLQSGDTVKVEKNLFGIKF